MLLRAIHTFQDHSGPIYGLSPGRSADTVFTASGDRFVVEWNIRTLQQERFAVKLEHPAYKVLFIAEFNVLIIGNSIGGLHVIDTTTKAELRYFTTHTNGIYDIQYNALERQVYVAGGDGFFSVWSLPDLELVRHIPICTEKLRQIRFSAQNNRVAIACGDGTVRIFDPVFFNEYHTIQAHKDGATAVAWHHSKPVLLTGGKDAMLRAFSTTDDFKEIIALPAHEFAIYAIAFSPDNQYFATASRDKAIKIWNASTLEIIERLDYKTGGHQHSVNDLIWNSEKLVSAGDDRKLIIWQTE